MAQFKLSPVQPFKKELRPHCYAQGMLVRLAQVARVVLSSLMGALGILWLCLPLTRGQNPPAVFQIPAHDLALGGFAFWLGYLVFSISLSSFLRSEVNESRLLLRSLGMAFTILGVTVAMNLADQWFSNRRDADFWREVGWAPVALGVFWMLAAICFRYSRKFRV
ncbi:MAG TPA: hypothetical protein VGL56_03195 [Fimbriimonadaceae bacterium]